MRKIYVFLIINTQVTAVRLPSIRQEGDTGLPRHSLTLLRRQREYHAANYLPFALIPIPAW